MAESSKPVARAETVGSLLQPDALLEARKSGDEAARHAAEDAAVDAAIELQESVGLDVITDGEMRRTSWADTTSFINGLERRKGPRSYPTSAKANNPEGEFNVVVNKITLKTDRHVAEEYPYLKERAKVRTKYTMAAPSYHRRYWSDTVSTVAYENCEAFLTDVRDWLRDVAGWLIAQGCDYIQLDAPNYGSLCDPETRAWHESVGHDVDKEIAFDAALDSSVFEGLPSNVTRALHICRGNQPGGTWHSSGGYGALADAMFPNLEMDTLLLEYDSDRAGDFAPLAKIKPGQVAVLGLLTTKEAPLESRTAIEARIEEAAGIKPLQELALSTQCGFASAQNAPMTVDEEIAKLTLVSGVAHSVWG
jgi:methionine synthase II (cobalamin-independent)